MSEKRTQGTSLLDLPAELRNRIYTLVIVSKSAIFLGSALIRDDITIHLPGPALLRANRQIRAESTGIYYGSNAFRTSSLADMKTFLTKLGKDQVECLCRLEIVFHYAAECRRLEAAAKELGSILVVEGLRKDAVQVEVPKWEGFRSLPWKRLGNLGVFQVVDGQDRWIIK